jgi:signal transduction histidine kinase
MAVVTIVLTTYGVLTLMVIGRSDHFATGVAMFAVFALGFAALTWLAFPRQPDNRALWVPAWASLLAGLATAGWATSLLIGQQAGLDMTSTAWADLTASDLPTMAVISFEFVNLGAASAMLLMITLWPLLFPDGELPSPRWRWVAWGVIINMAALIGLLLWIYRPGSDVPFSANPEAAGEIGAVAETLYLLLVFWAAVSAVSLLIRQRRSSGDTRQQYRWVTFGTFSLLIAVFVVEPEPLLLTTALICVALSVASYGVAVTKHRLYDIDVFVSRTFVYGTLAVFIGTIYVLVVVVIGDWLGSEEENLALAVAATALVGIAFEPTRRRAQRWANRLVYGRRATPYEVLSDLTQRLAGTEASQGILTRMAGLMAEGTGAEQATVWLADRKKRLVAAAGWPDLPNPARARSAEELAGTFAPVVHDDQLVGVLEITKARNNPVTPTEQHLIDDLAGSAGLVLGNQRLNASLAARATELQLSRRRLVEMQDAERRRLERDLHDGAQQQVIALKLKIGLAEHVARKEGADDLAGQLGALAAETQTAVDEIRTLAKGIYPPLLESEDLTAAIKSQAAASPVPIAIESAGVDHYPKDIESAAYFAALEAISNAVTHGGSSHVWIALNGTPDELAVEVRDNGSGFDSDTEEPGIGLVGIRDRVEALGGDLVVQSAPGDGTTVSLRIPLDQINATPDKSLDDPVVVSSPA